MMSELILQSSLPVPNPKEEVTIRPGTTDDITFIDGLQKTYNKNLGFLQTKALEGKINLGQVLIAENQEQKLGYIIAQDRYFKRDEVGMITQLVVAPGKQRSFIGAALLKAQFDRSAYGCRLYCCWCAQDLEANHFWESMGFYPLAFRMGSEKKQRVHIFWEKKIRAKDDTINWWFPHKTDQGAMRADRLAFPIPPGVHWKDVKPIEIPGMEKIKSLPAKPKTTKKIIPSPVSNKMWFASPENAPKTIIVREPAEKKPKIKLDPKFISAARELRDRYLEEVNENGFKLESVGKYELVRGITVITEKPILQIAA